MSKEIRFRVSEDEYDRFKQAKDANGLTWKGMMIQATKRLDSGEQ